MIRQPRFDGELKLRTVERCTCGKGQKCSNSCSSYESRKECPAFHKELMHPSMNVVVKIVYYRKIYDDPKDLKSEFKLEEVIHEKFPSKKDRQKMKRTKKHGRRQDEDVS